MSQQLNVPQAGRVGQTPVQPQQEQSQQMPVQQEKAVNYSMLLGNMESHARNNKDLTNFAYYLHQQELVKHHPDPDEDWLGIRMQTNFCNCGKMTSHAKSMNVSRLGQLYTVDIFGGDYFTTLWAKKEYMPENMMDRCSSCRGNDGDNFPICPYFLCYVIEKTAEKFNMSAEALFDDLLGQDKIPFRDRSVSRIHAQIPEEDLRRIDSKSAYGAHLLMVSRLFRVRSVEENAVSYTHLMLCRSEDKKNQITAMTDFWKTGSGVYGSIAPTDKVSLLQTRTEGCGQCEFAQCPHKLAAYFTWLAQKYGVDPIDLAYHVAKENTYGGIGVGDDYQFNRYLTHIRTAPMREESKAEFIKMIHYIAGRKANHQIPFLPFNMVIQAPDLEKANETASEFTNALWHFDYFRQGKENTASSQIYLSSVSVEDLCRAYSEAHAGTTFLLYDIKLLCENEYFPEMQHRLLKIMEDRRKDILSVIVGDRTDVTMFFSMYPEFRNKIFTKTLEMFDMDKTSVLSALLEKLEETFEISDDIRQRLAQYISVSYPAAPLKGTAYVNEQYEKILFNHYNFDVRADAVLHSEDIPYIKPPRSEQEIFDEINQLTGLDNVKEELRNIHNLVKFNIKMGANNKNAVNMHMMFTGNPGTGKTTVARLMAEILHNIGFIQEDKLVICSGKDLIAEYVGQTTIKTAKKCEMAYNGVLFIDEAYQLNPYTGHQADTFKEECIAELIQQMENNRDKLVVIFAGYTEEMMDFMNRANTGLRSRIGKIIPFPDYSAGELTEIFDNIVRKAGMQLGEGARERAYEIFREARGDAKRFGNARYARNLFERSLIQHAAITANLDADDPALKILRSDEITVPSV